MSSDVLEAKVIAWFGATTQAMDMAVRTSDVADLIRADEEDVLVELALGLIPKRREVEADLGPARVEKLRGMLREWAQCFKAGKSDGAQPRRIFEMLTGSSPASL